MPRHWTEPASNARLRVVRTIEYIGSEYWITNVLEKSLKLGHPLILPAGCSVAVTSQMMTAVEPGQATESVENFTVEVPEHGA